MVPRYRDSASGTSAFSAYSIYSMSYSRLLWQRNNERTIEAAKTEDQPAKTRSLLQLPTEVLLQIYDYFAIVDILLLARTCHLLRHLAIKQHRTIMTNDDEYMGRYAWYDCRRLIRKDKCYKIIEQQSLGSTSLLGYTICGGCLAPHYNHPWTAEELAKDPFQRVCQGRMALVYASQNWKIVYKELEMMRANRVELPRKHSQQLRLVGDGSCTVEISLWQSAASHVPRSFVTGTETTDPSHPKLTPLWLYYYFSGRIFDGLVYDCSICPHMDFKDVVERLRPRDSKVEEQFSCSRCYTTFRKSGASYVFVRRELGYGGNVPDVWWLAAAGLQPRSQEPCNARGKIRSLFR